MQAEHWQRWVWLLWLTQLLTIGAMEMSGPFWPLYFSQLEQVPSSWASAAAAMAYILPLAGAMISAPFWGRIGDRVGHKYMILRALIFLTLSQLLLSQLQDPFAILLVRLLQGLGAGSIAATQAYASKLSPDTKRGFVFSKIQSATAAGSLLGPLLGGYWLETISMEALFLRAGGLFLLILAGLAISLPQDKAGPRVKKVKKAARHREALPVLSPSLLLAAIALAQLAKRMPHSFYALYTSQVLGMGTFMTGVLYAGTGLGVLLGSPVWGRLYDRCNQQQRRHLLAGVAAAAMLLMLLQTHCTNFSQAFAVRVGWGVCLGALLPLLFAQLSALGNAASMGRRIGIGHSATKLGALLGIGIGALLFSLNGYQAGFIGTGLIYLALLLLLALPFSQPGPATQPSVVKD